MTSTRAMTRAKRAAHALHRGNEILDLVGQPAERAALIAAAEAGVAPISAVSEKLKAKIGDDINTLPVKSFVGICVRAVLEEEGFEVVQKGVRVSNDPVFRSGSVYRRVGARGVLSQASEVNKVVKGAIDTLTADELYATLKYIQKRIVKFTPPKK
jgi:hypothetical protein